MGANGLGSLPPEMAQFKEGADFEQLLTQTHNLLFEARNKLVAHFDRLHGDQLFEKGDYQFSPSEVIVDLQPLGSTVTTTGTHLNPELLKAAHGLFLFQMERVGKQLGRVGGELFFKHQRYDRFVFKVPN